MSRSIHRRALLRALCLPLLLVTIVACHRQDPSALNANELFFDETLASISPDATLPDLFYIGTEDGVVYAYDADQGTTRRWLTAFDRIYKVLRDQPADSAAQPHDGTTFWVGTRNMGVVRCQLQGDSLVLLCQYALPRSGRGTHYSVYDLHQDPSGLYVATSNGLFLLSPNDTMQALHASWEIQSGEGAFRPLVVSDIRPLHNGNLVCASASGVLSIDTRRRQSHLLLRANCTSLSLSGDTILALCGDSIKALLPDGRLVGKSRLSHPAYTCFHEPSTRMNYLLDGTSVQFFSNDEIADRLTPRRAPLPRPVRTFCHNVIANDPARGQSLLVTEHALLRVGHHQDLFSDIGNVSYACHDGPFIYYLVGFHLFRQRIGEQTAIQVKDLSRGSSDVRFMTIADGTLYYADSGHRVFTAPIYSSYLLNSLLSWDRKVSPQPGQDLTAIGHDGSGVYVGIRDGLQQLGREKGQLQLHDASASTIADPFITAFSAPTSSGRLFLATLNDGLFVGRQGSFRHLAASRGLSFVRDIAVLPTASSADSLFVLTNHRLLCGTEKQLRVCDTLTAMRRLAVADATHAYGFPDYGLISLADHERYFSDIRFNPKACIAVNGRVYAGSSCGVYTFDTSLHKQDNLERGYTTVQFERRVLFSRTNIACLVALTLVTLTLLWFFLALTVAKRRMLMRIEKLKTAILPKMASERMGGNAQKALGAEMGHLHKYLQRLDHLEQQVTSLSLVGKIRQRDIIDRLNSNIQDLTIDLPSILIGCLNRQVALMRRRQWEGLRGLCRSHGATDAGQGRGPGGNGGDDGPQLLRADGQHHRRQRPMDEQGRRDRPALRAVSAPCRPGGGWTRDLPRPARSLPQRGGQGRTDQKRSPHKPGEEGRGGRPYLARYQPGGHRPPLPRPPPWRTRPRPRPLPRRSVRRGSRAALSAAPAPRGRRQGRSPRGRTGRDGRRAVPGRAAHAHQGLQGLPAPEDRHDASPDQGDP